MLKYSKKDIPGKKLKISLLNKNDELGNDTNLNDYNIIINKCFNIIRMLMHIKDFVINNYELKIMNLEKVI